MKNYQGKYANQFQRGRRLMRLCLCGCRRPLSIYHEKNQGDFLAAHWERYWKRVRKEAGIQERPVEAALTVPPVKPLKPENPPRSRKLRYITKKGYILYRCPSHPAANKHGFVLEHRLIAARALGRPLEKRHPVHHVDGVKTNNCPSNLVICESEVYHQLLHERAGMRYWGDNKRKS